MRSGIRLSLLVGGLECSWIRKGSAFYRTVAQVICMCIKVPAPPPWRFIFVCARAWPRIISWRLSGRAPLHLFMFSGGRGVCPDGHRGA
eukprot:5397803-Amphidinium_carterae.1